MYLDLLNWKRHIKIRISVWAWLESGHSSESTSYIRHRMLRADSWEGEQDRNLPLLDTWHICHILGILVHMLHKFLNTRIGFLHLTITAAPSWEPLVAIKCSCFTRSIQQDSQCQISHALNMQAVRSTTVFKSPPKFTCQIPARKLIH